MHECTFARDERPIIKKVLPPASRNLEETAVIRLRVTINDVARLAGVSKATVSYVLNNDWSHVSAETAERVYAAMRKLNYRPNAVARSLVRRRTHVIGIVVANIDRSPYPEAVRGISDTVRDHGYNVLLQSSDGLLERELVALELLHERLADAMIIVSASGKGGNSHLVELVKSGIPVAVVNRYHNDLGAVHSVHIDNVSGVFAATQHLIELGHRRLGCLYAPVTGPEQSRAAIERLQGFRKAMAQAGLPIKDEWLCELPLSPEESWEAAVAASYRMLSGQVRPTALVCTNDFVALGVVRAAQELGLNVPRDLAVIGHDNTMAAAFCTPRLTTVRQPMYAAGVEAAKAVLNALAGETDTVTVTLPCELIIRESCGAATRRRTVSSR